jgi:hypothetical protein
MPPELSNGLMGFRISCFYADSFLFCVKFACAFVQRLFTALFHVIAYNTDVGVLLRIFAVIEKSVLSFAMQISKIPFLINIFKCNRNTTIPKFKTMLQVSFLSAVPFFCFCISQVQSTAKNSIGLQLCDLWFLYLL